MLNKFEKIVNAWIDNRNAEARNYHCILTNTGLKYYPILCISWEGNKNLQSINRHLEVNLEVKTVGSYKLKVSEGYYHTNLLEQIHAFKPWWQKHLKSSTKKISERQLYIYFNIFDSTK